jgi:hypothetical protein
MCCALGCRRRQETICINAKLKSRPALRVLRSSRGCFLDAGGASLRRPHLLYCVHAPTQRIWWIEGGGGLDLLFCNSTFSS